MENPEFKKLLDMVKVDSGLSNLSDEEVTEWRKKLNPYGRTIEGSGAFTCISITNLSEKYLEKFLMTSLIGFLYRRCDEYELSSGEPPCPMDDFDTFMLKYSEAVSAAKKAMVELAAFNREHKSAELTIEESAVKLDLTRAIERGTGFKRRLVVRQFLDGLFSFNPDKHVRSAYSDNPGDPERTQPACVVRDDETEGPRNNTHAASRIPPADTFHRWKYYTDSNFEEIRSAVNDIYSEKPDMEFAINPLKEFDTKEKADEFVRKHKNELTTEVMTLSNNKWNLCGSFKENRKRINFYNENTIILEEILKQIEKDEKLGAQLMKQRVAREKAKNVAEAGPDSEELKAYKKLQAYEETKEEKVEESFKISDDCPYNAVQVDVFDMRNGGADVKKSEFFVKAEAPTNPRDVQQ